MTEAFKKGMRAKLNEMIAEKQVEGAALRDAIDEMLAYDLHDLPANVRFLAGLAMLARGMTRPEAIQFTIEAMEADIREKMKTNDRSLQFLQGKLAELDHKLPTDDGGKPALRVIQ